MAQFVRGPLVAPLPMRIVAHCATTIFDVSPESDLRLTPTKFPKTRRPSTNPRPYASRRTIQHPFLATPRVSFHHGATEPRSRTNHESTKQTFTSRGAQTAMSRRLAGYFHRGGRRGPGEEFDPNPRKGEAPAEPSALLRSSLHGNDFTTEARRPRTWTNHENTKARKHETSLRDDNLRAAALRRERI